MKYYKLTYSTDKRIIGKYPQYKGIKTMGDFVGNQNLGWDGPIKNIEKLPEIIMTSKAKETTFFDVTSLTLYLIVKKYFIEFLNQFNVNNHQSWDIKVFHNNKVLDTYCLFHLVYPSQQKYVDFSKSILHIGKLLDWKYKGKIISIKDYNSYQNMTEVLNNEKLLIKWDKMVIDLSNAKEDLFRLVEVPFNGYFVSERLKNAIEEKKYTGMAFKELTEVDKRIEVIY